MSKLFHSFSVGFNGAFYFREESDKTKHDTLGCKIPSHFVFLWSASCKGPSKQILVLILTDRVIINIRYFIHTVSEIKSQHYKWNVLILPAEAAVCIWSSIFTGKHLCCSLWLIKLPAFRFPTLLKSGSNTGFFLRMLQIC